MILQKPNGDVFEDFLETDETLLSSYSPLTHSLIVVRHNGAHLLVFNKYKGHWELAGGCIEAGESPRACVLRELREESNQTVSSADFVGVMKFHLMPDHSVSRRRVEFGALYHSELQQMSGFEENGETAGICFWNGNDDIGPVDPIDAMLIRIAEEIMARP